MTKERFQEIRESISNSPAIFINFRSTSQGWEPFFISDNIQRLGYDKEDLLSLRLDWLNIVHPEDKQDILTVIGELDQANTGNIQIEFRAMDSFGGIRWMKSSLTAIQHYPDEQAYYSLIMLDITALKKHMKKSESAIIYQQLLNEILTDLNREDAAQAFRLIMAATGEKLGLSRIILFQDDAGHNSGKPVFEWCKQGIARISKQTPYLYYMKDLPEIAARLKSGSFLAINSGEIPPGCAGEFARGDVLAAAAFPLFQGEARYGMVLFEDCLQDDYPGRRWDDETLIFLEIISRLLAEEVNSRSNSEKAEATWKMLKSTLDNIPSYLYVEDPSTNEIIFANKAFKKDFTEEAESSSDFSILHDTIRNYCKNCPKFAANGRCISHKFELEQNDFVRFLEVNCTRINWLEDKPVRLFHAKDITEMKDREERLEQVAYVDQLTKLANRHQCNEDLKNCLERLKNTDQQGYVILLDMDDFKIVNDGYGHDYGDALLKTFAKYLKTTCMPNDKLFRFGGDEFIVIVHPDNAANIEQHLKKILERSCRPWQVIDKDFYCTISAGVVKFPDGDLTARDIFKNLELSMYSAKKTGKNAYKFYDPTIQSNSFERAEMEGMMRKAIANNFEGFEVYYQPMVDINSGVIYGAEALIRWNYGDRLITPMEFIPLAEYLGLIVPLGEFVLREAAHVLKLINQSGWPDFIMSVNLSVRQLQQQDITLRLQKIIRETEINPYNLVFEVTETVAAKDIQRIIIICNELRKMGARIAIDDFGTGYSSLSSLRDLPIDIIKIDRSFINQVAQDAYANSFIHLISELGFSMEKQICIEGVETAEQLGFCKTTKADSIQGFYYFKPMANPDFLKILNVEQ